MPWDNVYTEKDARRLLAKLKEVPHVVDGKTIICLEFQGAWRGVRGHGKIVVEGKGKYAHRVVMELKARRYLASHETVMHVVCDNPICCNPDHLKVGSLTENNQDCEAKGRRTRGKREQKAYLTEDQVREIRVALKYHSVYEVGRRYNRAPTTIRDIKDWHTWKHVTLPDRAA